MRRRSFLLAAGALVTTGGVAQVGRMPRIGYLSLQSEAAERARTDAFRQGLRERGFEEGRHVAIEYRYANGVSASLPALATELAGRGPKLIVAVGLPAIRAAHKAAPDMPIIFPLAGDAVRTGLVTNLSRPGGRLTGLTSLTGELGSKRLALLKETVPGLRRVAVLWNPANPVHAPSLDDLGSGALQLQLQLSLYEVRSPEAFEDALAQVRAARAEALFLLPDEMFHARRRQVAAFALQHRLPGMYFANEWVEDGGLMSYGAHIPDLFHRAAGHVARVLQGADPGDLPVEQPTRFELIVNQRTAKAIGLMVPQSVLLRADRVIR